MGLFGGPFGCVWRTLHLHQLLGQLSVLDGEAFVHRVFQVDLVLFFYQDVNLDGQVPDPWTPEPVQYVPPRFSAFPFIWEIWWLETKYYLPDGWTDFCFLWISDVVWGWI